MIFWSKNHYGVITDGIFSVDTDLGVNINSKGNIDIQSTDKKFTIYTGQKGTVSLGDYQMQPAVLGNSLEQILEDILTAIINLADGGLLTPAGPTSLIKPTTLTELKDLKKDLKNMKSTAVEISSGFKP